MLELIDVGTVRLAFERVGHGEPVVLAAGSGMPPAVWELCGVRSALVDAGFEVITFAARGVAPSDAPPSPYTIEAMADDLIGLVRELGIRRCSIVGYSLGGFVAEHVASTRADLLAGVVLLASAGPRTPVVAAAVDTEAALIAELGHLPAAFSRFESLYSTLASSVLRDDPATTSSWWELLAAHDSSWTSVAGACGQSAAAHAWIHDDHRMSRLRSVDTPVLVVAFENDLYFPPDAGRTAAAVLPLGRFVEIPDAAHGGLVTHPSPCIDVLLPFLTAFR